MNIIIERSLIKYPVVGSVLIKVHVAWLTTRDLFVSYIRMAQKSYKPPSVYIGSGVHGEYDENNA